MNDRRNGRVKLLLLAALFFAPVVAAVWIFFRAPDLFQGRLNHGTLVSPARPLPHVELVDAEGVAIAGALHGKWTLVYLAGAECREACQARLVLTRQVRLALNQNRGRVQRVYLAPSAQAAAAGRATLAAEHPDLVFVAEPAARLRRFFQPHDPEAVYLLDPLGHWLMVYAGDVEHKGMHRDLKKLLRVSRIG